MDIGRPQITGSARWSLFGASVALGLTLLNTTSTNVALPAVQEALGGDSVAGLQWVSNGYAVAFASLLLPAGAVADRLGARRILLAGAALFGAGSAVSAAAPVLGVLVAGQLLAGVGAAAITPSGIALIREAFPDSRERTRAIAFVSIAMAVGFGGGPVAAGVLIDVASWRAVFLIALAGALAVMVVVRTHVPPTPTRVVPMPNPAGVALGVLALASLTFTLIEGASIGWGSTPVVLAAAVTLSSAVAFVAAQRRGDSPLLPGRLFAAREVPTVALCGVLFNFTAFGQLFFMSLYFQRDLGLSPLETALVFLPAPVGTTLAAPLVGQWIMRTGTRLPLAAGFACNGLGVLVMVFADGGAGVPVALAGLLVLGVAGGLVVTALNTVVAVTSPPDLVGVATALLNASRQVGGVLGVAILGALVGGGRDPGGVDLALVVAAAGSFVALVAGWVLVRSGPAREGSAPDDVCAEASPSPP